MSKPKIRFKGFEDDWEQRKLGELGEIMTGSTPSTSNIEYYSEDGIPWVTPTDINALTISDTPRKLSEKGMEVGRVVPANTILCTCIASIGKNVLLTVKGSFNQQINSLTPSAENDAYFLLTESELWSNKMKRIAASGTMQIINKTEFSELITLVPSTDEQKTIGSYFQSLDHLITLHQRKCDETQKLKKFMLQKMFPQNEQNVPKIRFKGFTDPWEQRKLGELLDFHNGFNGSTDRYGTGIPLISVMDILNNDVITSENIRAKAELNETEFQRFKVEYGDVLFQRSSENVEDAGTSNVYMDKDKSAVFGGFVICGKRKTEYNPLFMKYGLTSKKVRIQIMSKAQGAQHINVSQDTLQGIKFFMPSQYEQDEIGAYLFNLDYLITLHQHKCDELQKIKKFMLQKMFVQEK